MYECNLQDKIFSIVTEYYQVLEKYERYKIQYDMNNRKNNYAVPRPIPIPKTNFKDPFFQYLFENIHDPQSIVLEF